VQTEEGLATTYNDETAGVTTMLEEEVPLFHE
jgi:hypothetical protein